MAEHRRNRDGKIWQRASDGRYCARAYPPVAMGGKSRLVYGRTWEDCDDKRRRLETELAQGLPGEKDQPLAEWIAHWLDDILASRVAAKKLSQSTLDSYRIMAGRHIVPALGGVPLRRLSVSRIRQWQHDLIRKPSGQVRKKLRAGEKMLPPQRTLSLRTVAYCQAILRAALNDAIRDELLTRNVAALVEPPGGRADERAPVPKAQMRLLLDVAGKDPLWCYWFTVVRLGLRRGEALALRWQDIDFEARTVKITGSLQRVTQNGTSKLARMPTKTKASAATLAMGDGLLKELRKWQREQRKLRMAAPAWLDTDLVFTTSIGTAIEPRNVNRAWEAICNRAGVPARIHDLRHAFGTYVANEGIPQKAIQSVLRHTRMATTDIYMHPLDEVSRAAVDAMDAMVTSLRTASGEAP